MSDELLVPPADEPAYTARTPASRDEPADTIVGADDTPGDRRRLPVIVGAVALFVLAAGVGFAVVGDGPREGEPAAGPTATSTTTATPSLETSPYGVPTARPVPGSSARVTSELARVDWRNVTLRRDTLPAGDRCATRVTAVRNGRATIGPNVLLTYPGTPPVALADVTGDGRAEALLRFGCAPPEGQTVDGFMLVGGQPSAPRVLAAAYLPAGTVTSLAAIGTVVTVGVRRDGGAPEFRSYRWQYGRLVASAPPPSDAPFDWTAATLPLPFTAATVPSTKVACTDPVVSFTAGRSAVDNCAYFVVPKAAGDVNGDRRPDAVLELGIGPADATAPEASWLYAYTVRNGQPVALGFLTQSRGWVTGVQVTAAGVVATQRTGGTRTFRWTGAGFTPSAPPPAPTVDQAP